MPKAAKKPAAGSSQQTAVAAAAGDNEQSQKLSPLELHALAIVAKGATKLRGLLKTELGQTVDFTVHVRGAVNVKEGTTTTKTRRPELVDVLAVAISLVPKTGRDKFIAVMVKALAGAKAAAVPADLKASAENLLAAVSVGEEKPKRGDVTGSLKLTKVASEG